MSEPRFVDVASLPPVPMNLGVNMRFIFAERMMMAEVHYDRGASNELHTHPEYEMMVYVVSGIVHFELDGETRRLSAGGAYVVPVDVPHRMVTVEEPAVTIEFFSPPRTDWHDRARPFGY